MFDADRQADHIFGDASLGHFGSGQLAVRGRGRVAGECLAVADVDQAGYQLQGVLEFTAAFAAALDAKAEDAGSATAHVFLDQRVVLVGGLTGVVHPGDFWVVLQEVGDLQRVVADAVHAQGEGFDALQDHEGVERADGGAHVAQRHGAGATDVGGGAEGFGVDHAVVGNVRLVEALELGFVFGPGELAAVDNDAAEAVAVAAEVFGQRMDDDVGAVLEGAAQVGRGHGVVDDDRHAVLVGNFGQLFEVGDVAQRVADGFAEDSLGLGIDQFLDSGWVVVVGKADVDAVLREGMGEQVVGAAVERARRDDVVTSLGNSLD